MSEFAAAKPRSLDPWVASSLLQKAIRRGEGELAQQAAAILMRHRGSAAVWRRLMIIAAEDVGIADIGLLHEIARLGSDKALRSVLGSDTELIGDLCVRLAAATKDRSADYLYCAATKPDTAALERGKLQLRPSDDLIGLAADETVPLTQRALAASISCAHPVKAGQLVAKKVEQFLGAMSVRHLNLEEAVLRLGMIGAHPFFLMLPLIWCHRWHSDQPFGVIDDYLPLTESVDGVPLYAFDKHTAPGKQAIRRFSRENDAVRSALAKWAAQDRRARVAEMAVFYADAVPLARRLHWPSGSQLAQLGFLADMMDAGCGPEGAYEVLECVSQNLDHLNQLRRMASLRTQLHQL